MVRDEYVSGECIEAHGAPDPVLKPLQRDVEREGQRRILKGVRIPVELTRLPSGHVERTAQRKRFVGEVRQALAQMPEPQRERKEQQGSEQQA